MEVMGVTRIALHAGGTPEALTQNLGKFSYPGMPDNAGEYGMIFTKQKEKFLIRSGKWSPTKPSGQEQFQKPFQEPHEDPGPALTIFAP